MQHFNFNTMSAFNPMESVTKFFVNPYMPEGALTLKLASKVPLTGLKVAFFKGLTIVLFPLEILQLGKAFIQWTSDKTGIITANKLVIYFQIESEDTIRINTILM